VEGLDYPINIEDGASGPANRIAAAIRGIERAVGATAPSIEELGGLLHEVGGKMFGGVTPSLLFASAISRVASEAIEAAEAVGKLAVSATEFAIDAAMFRQDTTLAYSEAKGSAEEGKKAFEYIDKIASSFHMPAEKAHGLARDLMLQGLNDTKLIGETIEAQAALMRTGQIAGAEKLQKIIERSTASGHFDPGKLGGGKKGSAPSGRALAGLGVSLPGLIDQIAKDTRKSVGQVKAELKAGQITVEEGVTALTEKINSGVIGQTARAKYDIHDFTTDSSNFFRRMVQGIDLKPLEQGLLDVSTALGFVADHKGGIEAVFQTIVEWMGKTIDAGVILGEDLVIAGLRAELAFAPLIHILERGYHIYEAWSGFADAHPILKTFTNPIGSLLDSADHQAALGAKETGVKMGDDLISGARKATHTHSPSEDMRDFGHDLRSGLDLGFKSDTIGKTVNDGVNSPGGSDTPTSTVNHINVGGITVVGGDDKHGTAALLESQIADMFERVALELGQ
jgi:hypothetical protein